MLHVETIKKYNLKEKMKYKEDDPDNLGGLENHGVGSIDHFRE